MSHSSMAGQASLNRAVISLHRCRSGGATCVFHHSCLGLRRFSSSGVRSWCRERSPMIGIHAFKQAAKKPSPPVPVRSIRTAGEGHNLAELHYNRGLTYKAEDDYDHAIADYTEAIRLDPNYQR